MALNSNNKNDSYVGYYADINEDGLVDGVIFVDLLTGSIRNEQKWTNDRGVYRLPTDVAIENVNTYYISQDSYTWSGITKPVISPRTTSEKDRFYVMQLSNFTTEEYTDEIDSTKNYPAYTTYYWYKNAKGKMTASDTLRDFGKGRENTGKIIDIWNANGGTGGYTNATQDNQDIWKHIQILYDNGNGWFIPSRSEWSAFVNELGITGGYGVGNFNSKYGLDYAYWTSSQGDSNYIFVATFYYNEINGLNADGTDPIRLATTF